MEGNIKMTYYLKRGTKYYFKCSDGTKLMINTTEKLDIKRNQEVLIKPFYGR